jgi:tetratricopeptide (TPR) repeat protein
MGDLNAIASRRYDLARVAWSRGDYEVAARFYEETLSFIRRESNNRGAIAGTLYDLGEVAWAQGNLGLAAKNYEESLTIGREIGAQFTIAIALNGLGKVARARGEYEKAHSLHKEALTILRGTGNRWSIAYLLEAFTTLAVLQNDLEYAIKLFGASESFYTQFRFLMSPLERRSHEQSLETARAAVAGETFEAWWAEGCAMTMGQAVDYALSK